MSFKNRFNPRAREGRDIKFFSPSPRVLSFNPRAREGRDPPKNSAYPSQECFNPRAREGRDQDVGLQGIGIKCFNPRAREGRDPNGKARQAQLLKFQSTRPRGARLVLYFKDGFRGRVSIHAPARGATTHRWRQT